MTSIEALFSPTSPLVRAMPVDDLISLTWTCRAARSLFDLAGAITNARNQRGAAVYDSPKLARAVARVNHAKDYDAGMTVAARRGCLEYAKYATGKKPGATWYHISLACWHQHFEVVDAIMQRTNCVCGDGHLLLYALQRIDLCVKWRIGVSGALQQAVALAAGASRVDLEGLTNSAVSELFEVACALHNFAAADYIKPFLHRIDMCDPWIALESGYDIVPTERNGLCSAINARRPDIVRAMFARDRSTINSDASWAAWYLYRDLDDIGIAMLREQGATFDNADVINIGIVAARSPAFSAEIALGRRPDVLIAIDIGGSEVPPLEPDVAFAPAGSTCRNCAVPIKQWRIMCKKCCHGNTLFAFWAVAGAAVICPVAADTMIPANCATHVISAHGRCEVHIGVECGRFVARSGGPVLYCAKFVDRQLLGVDSGDIASGV